MGWIHEKTRGKKSCATVPLSTVFSLCYFVLILAPVAANATHTAGSNYRHKENTKHINSSGSAAKSRFNIKNKYVTDLFSFDYRSSLTTHVIQTCNFGWIQIGVRIK
jgi:hypothetical protein